MPLLNSTVRSDITCFSLRGIGCKAMAEKVDAVLQCELPHTCVGCYTVAATDVKI